jgi:TolA-binding protein
VDRYPESQLAPQALYLIAKAHLEQRRYPESIEVLSDLINDFPDHPLHGRWLFTRGFNQVVLEAYAYARADFNSYTSQNPQGQLAVNARLWNALTYFFERNYAVCIEELSELGKLDSRHPLYP